MERKGAYYALVAAQESSEKAEEDKTKESEYLDLDLLEDSGEQRKKHWLFRVYRGLYYPNI